MSNGLSDFERRLAQKEKADAAKVPATPEINWDEYVPDVEASINPEEKALDDAIKHLNIADAYIRWCGKSRPDTRSGRQKEGIKVSCPNPAHPDVHPSAWLNTDKGLYHCPGCAMGGDVWDIAAWHFGYSVPGYKRDPAQFRELREKIGVELGFQTIKGIAGTYLVPPGDESTSEELITSTLLDQGSIPTQRGPALLPSGVEYDQSVAAIEASAQDAAHIDWRTIVPADTFLRAWLETTTADDCPEEYHFWTGLMAIGFAVGRHRVLMDSRPVMPNLFICFVGPSGAGKSSAKAHLVKIVQDVMPYKFDDPMSTGTKHVSSPGSAEYVVKTFSSPIPDPALPKKILGYAPVRAQIDFEELSSLVGISSRAGSVMKPVLLEIYDGAEVMGSGSLTHGERVAIKPFGQVTSTTQDGSLKILLGKSDEVSGFMNRWVFVSGKLKRQRSLGGAAIDFTRSTEILTQIHRWAGTSKFLTMTPDAYSKWDEFFHDVLVPVKRASEIQGSALLNRMDLLYKKLMVLLSCNMMEDEISLSAVEQAIALYPYLMQTYGVVSREMEVTEESSLADQITDAIRRFMTANNRPPSVRDLHIALKRKTSNKLLLEAIKNLVLLGAISEMPSPKGQPGRPTVRYAVND